MSYPFYPRPEAQATTWDELMPPVQIAVRDLLVRIQGAHQSIKPNPENHDKSTDSSMQQTVNGFLVYGSRGTGKTTVLLNAQRAICRKDRQKFFDEITQKESSDSSPEIVARKKIKQNAQEKAESLHKDGLVWLEILNLEPLPSEANLLTVLLTQVRNALHNHSDKRQSEQERRSIFEEEANSARQQLNVLISDATLTWQNITEQDTRSISNRQVKAADIYDGFQEKFKKAMDKLAEELREVHSLEHKPSIVLPIDNIDRSTEHLQAIVKLAQLVSHPNLWLVMAGDRLEIETFLERVYWKELIRGVSGGGVQGKMGGDGEDETLVMARRQANATAQKLWPANHRVEIDFVRPEETLEFIYKNHSASNTDALSIKDLLNKIHIPTTSKQRKPLTCQSKEKTRNVTLLDLFEVSNKLIEQTVVETIFVEQSPVEQTIVDLIFVEQKKAKPRLTRTAHHGLLLPARSVLDLWQLLDWLIKDSPLSSGGDFNAEKVARTMLRTAIASSDMPHAIAQKLQHDIIRRGEKGGTNLYFKKEESLKLSFMTSANHDFEYALTSVISKISSKHTLSSRLVICNIEDVTLSLQHNHLSIKPCYFSEGSANNQYPQPFIIENANKRRQIEFPPLVAAWLEVLHDILMLAENDASSWVICDLENKWLNVSIHQTVAVVTQGGKYIKKDFKLYWNAPDWRIFWGRNLFRLNWQDFIVKSVKILQDDQQQVQALAPRLLAAGWIFCVLQTSGKLISSIDPDFKLQGKDGIREFNNEDVQEFEIRMMVAAADFYQQVDEAKKKYHSVNMQQPSAAAYEVMLATGEWLETELIYFLSSAYVPIESKYSKDSKERLETIWKSLDGTALQTHWKYNLPFILAELDEKLSYFEDKKNGKTETEKNTESSKEKDTKSLAELLFADLYQKLALESQDRDG